MFSHCILIVILKLVVILFKVAGDAEPAIIHYDRFTVSHIIASERGHVYVSTCEGTEEELRIVGYNLTFRFMIPWLK